MRLELCCVHLMSYNKLDFLQGRNVKNLGKRMNPKQERKLSLLKRNANTHQTHEVLSLKSYIVLNLWKCLKITTFCIHLLCVLF